MVDKSEIALRWSSLENTSFPIGHRSIQIDGIGLTLIEGNAGSNIISFLNGNQALPERRAYELTLAMDQLEKAVPECTPEGKKYFGELVEIIKLVLAANKELARASAES